MFLAKSAHRTQYAAIDPPNPLDSAAGKTVVVSGGAAGIGYAMAWAFAQAGAANIAVIACRQQALHDRSANYVRKSPKQLSKPASGPIFWKSMTTPVLKLSLNIVRAFLRPEIPAIPLKPHRRSECGTSFACGDRYPPSWQAGSRSGKNFKCSTHLSVHSL